MRSTDFLIFPPSNLDFFWLVNFYFGFELPLCDFDLILFSPLLVVLELKFHFCVRGELRKRWLSVVGFKYMFTNKQCIKIKIKINSCNGVMDYGVMDFGFSVDLFCCVMIMWFDGLDEKMLTEGVLRPFELFPVIGFASVMVQGRGRMLVGGESFIRDDRVFRTTTRVGDIGFASVMVRGHGRMLVGVESFIRDDRVPRTTTRVGDIGFASVMVQLGHGRMLVGLRVMDSEVDSRAVSVRRSVRHDFFAPAVIPMRVTPVSAPGSLADDVGIGT
jgi:hypothetical protein